MPIDLLDELKWRGLFHQCTDEAGLREHLDLSKGGGPRSAYVGYDPTADSLTIGNLVTIMLLIHFQRAGHEPVVLMGGGTGLIGDPSGKTAERTLMTEETVRQNVEKQRPIFERLFTNAAKVEGREVKLPPILNNIDWLGKLGFLEALRDIGKHFSVNEMVKRDSVRMRLEERDHGISYTEFSYMILQSYDYLVLFRDFAKHKLGGPVTLQMGGSDQWGNIVGGTGLIQQCIHDVFAFPVYKRLAELRVECDHLADVFHESLKSQPVKPGWHEQLLSPAEKIFAIWHNIEMILSGAHIPIGGLPWVNVSSFISDITRHQNELSCQVALDKIRVYAESVVRNTRFILKSFGLTAPLITKADGGKFGKTESGAIWLTPERTSPYAYYQFWLNSSDADMGKFLRIFTLLPKEKTEAIEAEHAKDPGQRVAQRELARAATALLHGEAAVTQAEAAGKALFSGEIAGLDAATLADVFANVPSSTHPRSRLAEGVAVLDFLVETQLAASKREAKEFLAAGSVSINGTRKASLDDKLSAADLLHGTMTAIKRGKKNWHLVRWV